MASGGSKCCTVFAKIVLTLLNIFYLVNHSLLVPKFEVLFIFLCVGSLFISFSWLVCLSVVLLSTFSPTSSTLAMLLAPVLKLKRLFSLWRA